MLNKTPAKKALPSAIKPGKEEQTLHRCTKIYNEYNMINSILFARTEFVGKIL